MCPTFWVYKIRIFFNHCWLTQSQRHQQPEGSGHSSPQILKSWFSERQQFLSKMLAKPVIIFMLITVFMTSCTRENWLCNFFLFEAKAEIRRLLPEGLQESISKVRSSVVRCYIAIYFLKKTIKSMYVKARIFLPLICFYYNILHFAIKHTYLLRWKDKWFYTLWSYDHSNDPSGICNLRHCPLGLARSMAKFVWTSDAGINKWRQ